MEVDTSLRRRYSMLYPNTPGFTSDRLAVESAEDIRGKVLQYLMPNYEICRSQPCHEKQGQTDMTGSDIEYALDEFSVFSDTMSEYSDTVDSEGERYYSIQDPHEQGTRPVSPMKIPGLTNHESPHLEQPFFASKSPTVKSVSQTSDTLSVTPESSSPLKITMNYSPRPILVIGNESEQFTFSLPEDQVKEQPLEITMDRWPDPVFRINLGKQTIYPQEQIPSKEDTFQEIQKDTVEEKETSVGSSLTRDQQKPETSSKKVGPGVRIKSTDSEDDNTQKQQRRTFIDADTKPKKKKPVFKVIQIKGDDSFYDSEEGSPFEEEKYGGIDIVPETEIAQDYSMTDSMDEDMSSGKHDQYSGVSIEKKIIVPKASAPTASSAEFLPSKDILAVSNESEMERSTCSWTGCSTCIDERSTPAFRGDKTAEVERRRLGSGNEVRRISSTGRSLIEGLPGEAVTDSSGSKRIEDMVQTVVHLSPNLEESSEATDHTLSDVSELKAETRSTESEQKKGSTPTLASETVQTSVHFDPAPLFADLVRQPSDLYEDAPDLSRSNSPIQIFRRDSQLRNEDREEDDEIKGKNKNPYQMSTAGDRVVPDSRNVYSDSEVDYQHRPQKKKKTVTITDSRGSLGKRTKRDRETQSHMSSLTNDAETQTRYHSDFIPTKIIYLEKKKDSKKPVSTEDFESPSIADTDSSIGCGSTLKPLKIWQEENILGTQDKSNVSGQKDSTDSTVSEGGLETTKQKELETVKDDSHEAENDTVALLQPHPGEDLSDLMETSKEISDIQEKYNITLPQDTEKGKELADEESMVKAEEPLATVFSYSAEDLSDRMETSKEISDIAEKTNFPLSSDSDVDAETTEEGSKDKAKATVSSPSTGDLSDEMKTMIGVPDIVEKDNVQLMPVIDTETEKGALSDIPERDHSTEMDISESVENKRRKRRKKKKCDASKRESTTNTEEELAKPVESKRKKKGTTSRPASPKLSSTTSLREWILNQNRPYEKERQSYGEARPLRKRSLVDAFQTVEEELRPLRKELSKLHMQLMSIDIPEDIRNMSRPSTSTSGGQPPPQPPQFPPMTYYSDESSSCYPTIGYPGPYTVLQEPVSAYPGCSTSPFYPPIYSLSPPVYPFSSPGGVPPASLPQEPSLIDLSDVYSGSTGYVPLLCNCPLGECTSPNRPVNVVCRNANHYPEQQPTTDVHRGAAVRPTFRSQDTFHPTSIWSEPEDFLGDSPPTHRSRGVADRTNKRHDSDK